MSALQNINWQAALTFALNNSNYVNSLSAGPNNRADWDYDTFVKEKVS